MQKPRFTLLFSRSAAMMTNDYAYDHQKAARQESHCRPRRRDHTANPATRQCGCRGRCTVHTADAICEEKAYLGLGLNLKAPYWWAFSGEMR